MTITLIRHGRSAHVVTGLLDLDGFHRWREDYEAAGVMAGEVPPRELHDIAGSAGLLAASDARRAIESARLIASRNVETTPLLRELDLHPPNISLRMPLLLWALAIGFRFLNTKLSSEEQARIHDAATWLIARAERHGSVVAVTHGSMRWQLRKELASRGWIATIPRRRSAHWSAWSFARVAESAT